MKSRQVRNSLLLVLTAFIWGVAFVAQRQGGDAVGPFSFNGIRSLIGGAVLIPVIFIIDRVKPSDRKPSNRSDRKRLVIGGICCGTVLFLASLSIPRDAVERTSASAGPAVCSGPTRIWERTAFAKDQKRMLTSDMPLRAERPGTPLLESMRGVLFCHPDCQDVTGRQLRRDNSSHARRRSVRTD